MTKEFLKRPFSRPLLLWSCGILIQTYFHPGLFSYLLMLPPLLHLAISFAISKKQEKEPSNRSRWTWGAVFSCIFLFTAIQTTALHETLDHTKAATSQIEEWAQRARRKLTAPIDKLNLPEKHKSVLATITVGEKRNMSRDVKRQFSAVGLAHILSVSGFHVAIIGSFASLLLSPLKRNRAWKWVTLVITLSIVWTFAAITGLAPPSVRAAFMLSLYLIGQHISRTSEKYNTLFASAFCMLAYNPFFLFDIGFQLSYISVASIIYFYPRFRDLIKLRNPLLIAPWNAICISLAAQIGTTILCMYYFGQFSSVFLFSNLPITFIASLLVPVTIILMFLPDGFLFYNIVQKIVEALCQSMMWIVETFSRVPGATINFRFNFTTTLLSYFILILCCILYSKICKPINVKQQDEN
ncbi:MAG: ComEC/Rec2 family competence protein [Tannerellaceae bacterium]|jgi:competence protein ComEC|nr:ComEC/Rec2 family competence protein [Tannerellaceae bacterium]